MSSHSLGLSEELRGYVQSVGLREPELWRQLREETAQLPMARMQISPEQGAVMRMIVSLMGAKSILEVGSFTGYSGLCLASALPKDGQLICLDVSKEWTDIAWRYWDQFGVGHKITLKLAPATQSLKELAKDRGHGWLDLAFVDALKTEYLEYVELIYPLLRPGGLIMVDNVLWGGSVIDDHDQSADTKAIRVFNQKMHDDPRFELALAPVGDGLSLLRKL